MNARTYAVGIVAAIVLALIATYVPAVLSGTETVLFLERLAIGVVTVIVMYLEHEYRR